MNITNAERLGQRAIKLALTMGVSDIETFMSHSRELSIEVSKQKVETMKLADQQGMGIRVFKEGRMGYAHTSDLSESTVDQAVSQAVANSLNTSADKYFILPEKSKGYPKIFLHDPKISETPVEEKIELAKEIERVAQAYDPRIKIIEKCSYVDAEYQVTVCNSRGVLGSYDGAYCGISAFLVSEDNGESQTGFGFQYRLRYNELDPQAVAREGAEKAIRMLGATPIATRTATVIFDPYVSTKFLGLFGAAFSADAVQKGKSLLAGKTETKVTTDLISIFDDGIMENGIMSAPFDGEGVPTQRTVLVENGMLKGFLHNTYTAAKAGVQSTGNGMRGSYKGIPDIGTTNFYIANGKTEKTQMVKEVTHGIYITEVLGMHTANPISGDFSVGAAGLLIENGELTRPVRGIALAGNILDIMQNIDAVASDLKFFISKGSPTLRIPSMPVSGS